MKEIRSVSFDTSFLLNSKREVDDVLKLIKRSNIACYVTSTVLSELELLRVNGQISEQLYRLAMSRWNRVKGKVIDFRNRFLATEIKQECVISMGEHHGVRPEDIINDCTILVTSLKNGVDLFLSEDFHFTSKITLEVLEDVTNSACTEYHQMCGEEMYSIDTTTFLEAYKDGTFNLDVVRNRMQNIKKPDKLLKTDSN